MNKFIQGVESSIYAEKTRTREGDNAHSTIRAGNINADGVLPFFTLAGGLRGDTDTAWSLFNEAYQAHRLLAVRALFYLRYFRREGVTGNGERDMFRSLFGMLAERNDSLAASLVHHIPEFGRWDDVLFLLDERYKFSAPDTREAVVSLIRKQMKQDIRALRAGEAVSVMAKWLPSENASSKTSMAQARFLARRLGMRLSEYRNTLVALRKEIGIIESMISAGNYGEIDYSRVPAQAHRIYSAKFMQKDGTRYSQYLNRAVKGQAKINTTGLQAHQVAFSTPRSAEKVADAMWLDMLAKFDVKLNVLVALDSSASMQSWGFYGNTNSVQGKSPQDVGSALAAFFSETNKGAFKNWIINFQTKAKMFKVNGMSLRDRMANIKRMSSDHGSTNVDAVYKLILEHAASNRVPAQDMPEVVMILSDMQFSLYSKYDTGTAIERMRKAYKKAGYELPVIIMWNLNAVPSNSPVKADDRGTIVVNGFSQDVLRQILSMSKEQLAKFTPVGMMINALTSEPYSRITLE